MTIMNLILLLTMYPILLILYFSLANETKPKKNIILGATLPYASLRDPRVMEICNHFKQTLRRSLILLALLPIPSIFISYASIAMAVIFNWILVAVFIPMWIYAVYRRKLLSLKKELLHGKETLTDVTYVDIQASLQQPKPVSLLWHLPPLIMGLIPVIACLLSFDTAAWDGWLLFTYITMALMPALAMEIHGIFHRQNPDVVGDDSRINAALTRIRRRKYTQFCLCFSWLSGFLCLLLWLMLEQHLSYLWGMVGTALYTILILAVSLHTEFHTRRLMEQIAPSSPTDKVNDEDRYWIAGQFYYNPHDKHLMKDARIGIGSTVNMAHPVGKILMGFLILCLLALPLTSLWMIGEEFVPLTYQITANTIQVSQLWEECQIPLERITDVDILQERPAMSRIVGSSIGTLCKGRYQVADHGMCRVYIRDPEGPYLLIVTEDGKYLLEWTEELAAVIPR